MNNLTIDQKLRNLQNGGTLKLGNRTWAEKSGNGETVSFVRQSVGGNTTTVYRKVKTNTLSF